MQMIQTILVNDANYVNDENEKKKIDVNDATVLTSLVNQCYRDLGNDRWQWNGANKVESRERASKPASA